MVSGAVTMTKKRLAYILIGVMLPLTTLGLLALIAVSPIPMRGAELFGMIANKIKGHPGATAYLTIFAGSMLWVAIGLIAALEQWRTERRTVQTQASSKMVESRKSIEQMNRG